jgi:hypothetical protein
MYSLDTSLLRDAWRREEDQVLSEHHEKWGRLLPGRGPNACKNGCKSLRI